MQAPLSRLEIAKKMANEANNSATMDAYIKEGVKLGYDDDIHSTDDDDKDDDATNKDDEKKDGGKQLLQEVRNIDTSNLMHAPRCLRCAAKHKTIADTWRKRAWAEAKRWAKKENADPKKGLKKVAKQISKHAANSLRYVARDDKVTDGGKVGTLTANPKIIDGVITRAWQEVYKGNTSDPNAVVEAFMKNIKRPFTCEKSLCCRSSPLKKCMTASRVEGKQLAAWMGGNLRSSPWHRGTQVYG